MRKGIISFALLLTISLFPAYSATPPKAGTVCPKQGITKTYQGKKFTCNRSGKKLIWNAGEKVRKATPSPTPTIATTILRGSPEQIQSYENMKKAMVPGAVQQLFRFHYSPNAKNEFKDYLEFELNFAMSYWTSVYKNPDIFNVFYGTEKDLDWLIDAWRPYGFDTNKGFAEDLRGRIQREGNNLNAGAVPSQSDSSHLSILRHSSLSTQISNFVPHENVHIVQQFLSKNRTDKMPCWLREGSANLFGNFIYAERHGIDYYNRAKYGDINNYKWGSSGQELRNFTESQWYTHLKSLEGNFQGGCDYIFRFAYGSGLLLSETLMAQGGFDEMMDFWRAFALEKDWRVSFKEIYGIEIDTWYRQKAIPYVMKEYGRIK